MTFAKGITSGTVPMGGVVVRKPIYDAFMRGPEHVVELFHGYTYSAHPLACAAGLATLDLYRSEKLFERAYGLESHFADAAMSLKGLPNVLDIRTVGLTAGIDLASKPGGAGQRAYAAMEKAFNDQGIVIRVTGETIAVTPPLIVSEAQVGEIFDKIGKVIRAVA
jgi:beta-alanine--pyruvate transaminase